MQRSEVVVLIPVKPLAHVKSRLAPALSPEQRQQLTRFLLQHVIDAVRSARFAKDIAVVAGDSQVPRVIQGPGVYYLFEDAAWRVEVDETDVLPPPGGQETALQDERLSRVVRDALVWARDVGYTAALVLPADLPRVTASEIEALWQRAQSVEGPLVVIAPDAREQGTNALFLRPPDAVPPQFGPGSFRRHLEWATRQGILTIVWRSPGFGCDVDTFEDLQAYLPDWPNILRLRPIGR